VGKLALVSSKTPIKVHQLLAFAAVNVESVQIVQKLIAGGAVHRPIRTQPLAGAEDLFDDDITRKLTRGPIDRRAVCVERSAGRFVRSQCGRALVLKHTQVLSGIAQTVDVIDPQSADQTFTDQAQNEFVRRLENAWM